MSGDYGSGYNIPEAQPILEDVSEYLDDDCKDAFESSEPTPACDEENVGLVQFSVDKFTHQKTVKWWHAVYGKRGLSWLQIATITTYTIVHVALLTLLSMWIIHLTTTVSQRSPTPSPTPAPAGGCYSSECSAICRV